MIPQPLLDPVVWQDMCDLFGDALPEFCAKFITTAHTQLHAAHAATAEGNWPACALALHALSAPSAHIGAAQLVRLIERAETQVKTADGAALAESLTGIHSALEALEHHFATQSGATQSGASHSARTLASVSSA